MPNDRLLRYLTAFARLVGAAVALTGLALSTTSVLLGVPVALFGLALLVRPRTGAELLELLAAAV